MTITLNVSGDWVVGGNVNVSFELPLDVDGVVKKILTTNYVQEELQGIRH